MAAELDAIRRQQQLQHANHSSSSEDGTSSGSGTGTSTGTSTSTSTSSATSSDSDSDIPCSSCDCASQVHSLLFNTLEWCVRLHPAVGCELADIVDANGRAVYAPNTCARRLLDRLTRAAHVEQQQAMASLASKAATPQDADLFDFSEVQLSSINRCVWEQSCCIRTKTHRRV